jgi:hypothetical protein
VGFGGRGDRSGMDLGKQMIGDAKRLALVLEARRAERIIKLHWLRQRQAEVRRFLVELNAEVVALKKELRYRSN